MISDDEDLKKAEKRANKTEFKCNVKQGEDTHSVIFTDIGDFQTFNSNRLNLKVKSVEDGIVLVEPYELPAGVSRSTSPKFVKAPLIAKKARAGASGVKESLLR